MIAPYGCFPVLLPPGSAWELKGVGVVCSCIACMMRARRNVTSFSEKANVLSIIAKSELADKLDEGSLILVLVLQIAHEGVVPVV